LGAVDLNRAIVRFFVVCPADFVDLALTLRRLCKSGGRRAHNNDENEDEVFLGRSVTQHKQVSDVTIHTIDEEVRKIIDRNYDRAKAILTEHRDKLDVMAHALMKYETIDYKQVVEIMEGKDPSPPEGWEDKGDPKPPESGEDGKAKDAASGGPIGGPVSEH